MFGFGDWGSRDGTLPEWPLLDQLMLACQLSLGSVNKQLVQRVRLSNRAYVAWCPANVAPNDVVLINELMYPGTGCLLFSLMPDLWCKALPGWKSTDCHETAQY